MFSNKLLVRKTIGLALAISSSSLTFAAADTTAMTEGWKRSLTGNLNLSQSYYDNWSKGGTDALAWDLGFGGAANLMHEDYTWENSFFAAYGMTKVQALASRKSTDEWKVESIYTRKYGTWVNPFISARVNSQWSDGYSYNDSAKTRKAISTFFDPAYFTETVGLGFAYQDYLTERLGFTLKQTISDKYDFADDIETESKIEALKSEYGLGSVTEFKKPVMENVLLASRLEVFVNFKGFDEVDLNWDNILSAKVNKWISLNFNLNLLYDKDLPNPDKDPSKPGKDFNESVQIKQGLSVGISFLSL
jgi:Protein of unknown function (DUF3078)